MSLHSPLLQLSGESGGGQLLRSALSLSLVTGQGFRMTGIRAARPKPGLKRQHLTCVHAAATVGGARVEGASLHSQDLVFRPGPVAGGEYAFAIGTGGSTTLVLQMLLPALLHASVPSIVRIEGGTHNPMAPPFEFIDHCFLPVLRSMGADVTVTLERYGFMQAGGGSITASITPVRHWRKLNLTTRGKAVDTFGLILHAHLPAHIARREMDTAQAMLGWPDRRIKLRFTQGAGPGNAILLGARFARACHISSGVARIGASSEAVAAEAVSDLQSYLASTAPVGTHLADQLLLPLALAGHGKFKTLPLSQHTRTNISLIEKFLPIRFRVDDLGRDIHSVAIG